jgi:hypothetical protein
VTDEQWEAWRELIRRANAPLSGDRVIASADLILAVNAELRGRLPRSEGDELWRLKEELTRIIQEARDWLDKPGDGRDAARLTLYEAVIVSGACFIPPTEEEWEAARAKAEGKEPDGTDQ